MVSRHIAFSESIVLRELEKIARKTNLIPEEPKMDKTASAPKEVEQDTVSILESSEDLMADVMVLASQLRGRGFNKQAETLESKAILLKKAMAEGSHDSLYNFWKETGESVINFAHKTTDANVEGYKPKNLNEVRQSITSTLSQQPTGNQDKAIRLAQKVTYVLKKMGDGNVASVEPNIGVMKYRNLYDGTYNLTTYSKNVNTLMDLGYLNKEDWSITGVIPKVNKEAIEQIAFLAPQNAQYITENILDKGVSQNIIAILMSKDANILTRYGQSAEGLQQLKAIEPFIRVQLPSGLWETLKRPGLVGILGNLAPNSEISIDYAIKIKSDIIQQLGGLPGFSLDLTLSFRQEADGAAENLKSFFTKDGFIKLVTSYVSKYLSRQSDFEGKLKLASDAQTVAKQILGVLEKIRTSIPKNDENQNTIKEIQDKLETNVVNINDNSLDEYLDKLLKNGLDVDSLKASLSGYQSDLMTLQNKKAN